MPKASKGSSRKCGNCNYWCGPRNIMGGTIAEWNDNDKGQCNKRPGNLTKIGKHTCGSWQAWSAYK